MFKFLHIFIGFMNFNESQKCGQFFDHRIPWKILTILYILKIIFIFNHVLVIFKV